MKIVCDNCATKYSIADEKVRGKVFKIKCKKCSHIIVVKGQELTEGEPTGFDQKETRVVDYSRYEGAKDGQAEDPIWHLVIDKEQVGPLTVSELAQKFAGGEIDLETYTWREGFEDWKRLGSVDELAPLIKRAAPAEPPRPESLFGGTSTPTTDTAQGGRADPTDLFAVAAGSSTEDEAPGDLFGGRAPSPATQPAVFASSAAPVAAAAPARRSGPSREEQPLFSVAAAESGNGGYSSEPTAASSSDVRPMTAQRNENSVLFSLNNLAALASSEAGAASPRGGSGLGGSFASSGPEGSGLIDIRAMAAMTLGATNKREEGSRKMTDDDLPVFSASSFSAPAASVLLPTVQSSNNRTIYLLIGAFGLATLVALILLAVMMFGGRKPVAVAPPPTVTETPTPARTTPAPAPTATPPAASPPPAATPPAASPAPSVTPAPAPPPERRPRHPTERPAVATTPPSPAPEPRPGEPPAPPKPLATQKCDEVACLVTPDLPCCPKRGGSKPAPQPSADSGLADRLDQSDIIAGMKNVNGRVMGCNDRFHIAGAFKVKVTVAADGSVAAAAASPPVAGTGAASCVESAVRGAHFKKTKNSITFNYPYTFR